MPYVQVRTTTSLTDEKIEALKNELSPSISLIPGKSEAGLMIEFVGDCKIYKAGTNDTPAAYVLVLVNNEQEEENLTAYSRKVIDTLHEMLEIPIERIYVNHLSVLRWHSAKYFGLI